MNSHRFDSRITAIAACVLVSACQGVALDETDEDALFLDARLRARIDSSKEGPGPHVELGWTTARGETDVLDYSVDTFTLGGGVDFSAGSQGWFGIIGGFAWQQTDFETPLGNLHDPNALGPYFGLEGGWRATAWLEPCARLESAMFLDEYATTTWFEAGLRLHFVEHTAIFVGWRTMHVDIEDVESDLVFTSLELDASGLVVGLALDF